MTVRSLTTALLGAVLLSACGGTAQNPAVSVSTPPVATPGGSPTSSPAGSDSFTLTDLGRLDSPWAATFLPGTPYVAVTLKTGALVLRGTDPGSPQITVAGVPQVLAEGQGGLGDIAVAPGYDNAANRTVYLTWAEAGEGGEAGAVLGRAQLQIDAASARLADLEVIWRQDKVTGRGHYSHRIAVSPDGRHLFLSSGDRQKGAPAQDLTTNLGKVLRLNLDGTPAAGNPYADRGGRAAEVWASGLRNVLGLSFDADGRLWACEMGPLGGDEVNLVERGGNYGWPRASNGSDYGGGDIPDHTDGDGFVAPKVFWTPSISPGNLLVVRGDRYGGWQGDALVGALSGTGLWRVSLDGDQAVKADEWETGTRIRAVVQGLDGLVYVLEDGPAARLLRLTPR